MAGVLSGYLSAPILPGLALTNISMGSRLRQISGDATPHYSVGSRPANGVKLICQLSERNFIAVPPGRPLMHNERGILVEDVLGPYNEGAELMLTCSVSGGE